ncbi:hypothetical protein E2C01_098194 [Portunus trituberculatus]|uniref:Uncharacterized protein n=1 Tax=Portunus trituberculatus TaxID=210409 RepID=A0A5B7K0M0_PORTR|nr:hypothetical protein [Portunus trituberculatus]
MLQKLMQKKLREVSKHLWSSLREASDLGTFLIFIFK